MLIYPSKARNDIDIAICQQPADIPQEEWTPDKQFQAAMTKMRTSYAPKMRLILPLLDGSYKNSQTK
jgi:hypothetical protein